MAAIPGFLDSVVLDRSANLPGVDRAFLLTLETWSDAFRLTVVSEDSALVSTAPSELLRATLLDSVGNQVARAAALNGGGGPYRLIITFPAATRSVAAPAQLVVGGHTTDLL
ncbi:MAG TPA: hypothetical protein VGV93_10000 [Acidimicrobiales bacterium]|nr:hypothetical protein [Acidimicrobiales bacterium]